MRRQSGRLVNSATKLPSAVLMKTPSICMGPPLRRGNCSASDCVCFRKALKIAAQERAKGIDVVPSLMLFGSPQIQLQKSLNSPLVEMREYYRALGGSQQKISPITFEIKTAFHSLPISKKRVISNIAWIRSCWIKLNLSPADLSLSLSVEISDIKRILFAPLSDVFHIRPSLIRRVKAAIRVRLLALRKRPATIYEIKASRYQHINSEDPADGGKASIVYLPVSVRVQKMLEEAHIECPAPLGNQRIAMAINKIEGVDQDITNIRISMLVKNNIITPREGLLLAAEHARQH